MARTIQSRNQDAIETGRPDVLNTAERAFTVHKRIDMPPIVDFAEDAFFLNKRLYPRQKTLLRLICLETESMTAYDLDVINEWADGYYRANGDRIGVSPDIWKRIEWLKEHNYPHFREVVNVSGRRASKGLLGAVMGAYQNWRLLSCHDPQAYYGIEKGKELYCYITATTQSQAQAALFADLARTIMDSKAFQPHIFSAKPTMLSLQTDADRIRAADLQKQGVVLEREVASIINIAMSANSSSARGGAGFAAFFDEMAHMLLGSGGPRTAEAVYKALTPSLAQMGKDAFIYVPTSPLTEVGKAHELAEQAIKQDDDGFPVHPTSLLIQLPSWFMYQDWDNPVATEGRIFQSPQIDYETIKVEEKQDPESFRVEYRAQWAKVVDAFLRSESVEKLFDPIVDSVSGQDRFLAPQEYGNLKWIYRGHADPAAVHDNFAVCIGHTEPVQESDGEIWDHVFIDNMLVWKPNDYDEGHIDYAEVEEEIADLIMRFPALQVFSYDQYGSFVTVPQLRARLAKANRRVNVREVTHTVSNNRSRWDDFRAALGMGWIHAYRDNFGPDGASLLELELKFLQRRNERVDHQKIGPVTTDDLATAVSVVASELLGDQLQKLRRRRNLGNTQLETGAQGGYHSGTPTMSQARERLIANSKATVARASGRDFAQRGRRR